MRSYVKGLTYIFTANGGADLSGFSIDGVVKQENVRKQTISNDCVEKKESS
jgi:hypothetical protein